jgi:hypothetical protein
VLEGKVFVGKLGTINGFSTRSVALGEIASLAHETRNHTVKGRALKPKAVLSGAKSAEVLRSLRDNIGAKLHGDTPSGLSTDRDIKVNLRLGPANGVV